MNQLNRTRQPLLLCILDGVGFNPDSEGNAIRQARAPTLTKLFQSCPWTLLTTHGESVGLPAGQMGNSEVGHLTIGAGRAVRQWLTRVTAEFREGLPQQSAAWRRFVGTNPRSGAVHLIGLLSSGGVHSHLTHLSACLAALKASGVSDIVLHLISDGRDVPPNSFAADLERLQSELAGSGTVIGSVAGRFYAMDRDKRPERTAAYYSLLTEPSKQSCVPANKLGAWLQDQYRDGVTDEFLPCTCVSERPIRPKDRVLFWNFREDRMRQIVAALTAPREHTSITWYSESRPVVVPAEQTLCFTDYDPSLNLPVLFPPDDVRETLGDCVSSAGLTQLRCAETEKYPHVTYFFNGKREEVLPGEERILVPSPRDVKTYDLKPAMSAVELTDAVLTRWSSPTGLPALTVLNFANGDMVGHTGNLAAAITAVETVDTCLGRLLTALDKYQGQALIFADHGNAELMIDYRTGEPCTTHTTFAVPCFAVGFEAKSLRAGGSLCDIAPTALAALGLQQPAKMSGRDLLSANA